MNLKDAKPWAPCLVKAKVLGVIGSGMVVQMPGGQRVLIKREHMDAVELLDDAPEKKTVTKKKKETE